ncbi:MAG: hypothetical protein OIF58_02415, partial [Cohaesibacter sp.]|nr:hypothetical protein [Cohaesibacter sp.]
YNEIKLTAFDGEAGDWFGYSVSIDNNNVITIGAPKDDNGTGTAHIFSPLPDGRYIGPDGTIYGDDQGQAARLTINGSENANILWGGEANDIMSGGDGDDTFIFKTTEFGHDVITDFTAGANSDDLIDLSMVDDLSDFAAVLAATTDQGADTVIAIDADNSILLMNVSKADLHEDDFQFS